MKYIVITQNSLLITSLVTYVFTFYIVYTQQTFENACILNCCVGEEKWCAPISRCNNNRNNNNNNVDIKLGNRELWKLIHNLI